MSPGRNSCDKPTVIPTRVRTLNLKFGRQSLPGAHSHAASAEVWSHWSRFKGNFLLVNAESTDRLSGIPYTLGFLLTVQIRIWVVVRWTKIQRWGLTRRFSFPSFGSCLHAMSSLGKALTVFGHLGYTLQHSSTEDDQTQRLTMLVQLYGEWPTAS